jgi:hypothetical protein
VTSSLRKVKRATPCKCVVSESFCREAAVKIIERPGAVKADNVLSY